MELKTQKLMEKWRSCPERYPVLIIAPSNPKSYNENDMMEFVELMDARMIDMENRYAGKLSDFIVWRQIQTEIVESAEQKTTVVVNAEHFYDKWQATERVSFLKSLLRRDGHKGILLLIFCNENLAGIASEISKSERGVIWTP